MNDERIGWDEYFMESAKLASRRSPCERLHVGSVIVKNKRVIAMGYNGFISGAPHTSIVRDGHEQATIHSEMNAITDCANRGVSVDGATIYITHYPCLNCYKAIASSGIKKILYAEDYHNDELVEEINEGVGIEIIKLEKTT